TGCWPCAFATIASDAMSAYGSSTRAAEARDILARIVDILRCRKCCPRRRRLSNEGPCRYHELNAYDSPRGEPVLLFPSKEVTKKGRPGSPVKERPAEAGLRLHSPALLNKVGGRATRHAFRA